MINKAILLGRFTKDPEMIMGQTMVARFGLATSEKYKGVEKTEFHNLVAFGKLAEIIELYCRKGDLVYVEGKIQTEKYTDKNGVEKYTTKIIAQTLRMIPTGKRQDRSDEPQVSNSSNDRGSLSSPPFRDDKKAEDNSLFGGSSFTSDDIPF